MLQIKKWINALILYLNMMGSHWQRAALSRIFAQDQVLFSLFTAASIGAMKIQGKSAFEVIISQGLNLHPRGLTWKTPNKFIHHLFGPSDPSWYISVNMGATKNTEQKFVQEYLTMSLVWCSFTTTCCFHAETEKWLNSEKCTFSRVWRLVFWVVRHVWWSWQYRVPGKRLRTFWYNVPKFVRKDKTQGHHQKKLVHCSAFQNNGNQTLTNYMGRTGTFDRARRHRVA